MTVDSIVQKCSALRFRESQNLLFDERGEFHDCADLFRVGPPVDGEMAQGIRLFIRYLIQ